MKNFDFKKLLPHLIAIGVFLLATIIYCIPAFDNDVMLSQHDMDGVNAALKQMKDYYAANGHYSLWMPNMFSGTPAYNFVIEGGFNILGYLHIIFQFFLPQPMSFFFLACLCFYIMCMCFRVKPVVAIFGSLAFAFCTYNPIIISVGHITKMYSIAYAPALIGSVYLLLQGRLLKGFLLSALFASMQLMQNHPQISYYCFIIIGFMVLVTIVNAFKEKQILSLVKPLGLAILAATIGVCANAIIYFPVMDYNKESKRGGQLILDPAKAKDKKLVNGRTTGLDRDYAFQWSYGTFETVTLMLPGAQGYGVHRSKIDGEYHQFPNLDNKSKVYEYLTESANVPEAQAEQFSSQLGGALYWGDQPFTEGPVFLGSIICFLAIVSLFVLDKKLIGWIIGASIFGIFLSWGKHFPLLNNFLFDYLPYYKVLRAPSMALVIPQILLPLSAVLTVNKIGEKNIENILKKFRNAEIATIALMVVLLILGFVKNFSNENKAYTSAINRIVRPSQQTLDSAIAKYGIQAADSLNNAIVGAYQAKVDSVTNLYPPLSDNSLRSNLAGAFQEKYENISGVMAALQTDRASFYFKDWIVSLFYLTITSILLLFLIKNKLNLNITASVLALLCFAELFVVNKNYFNKGNFISKDEATEKLTTVSPYDQQILKDKDPNFRVYNTTVDAFSDNTTSINHKSIGGYSPMKIGIYDDLYSYQLSGKINDQVLNMLNCKYIIKEADKVKVAAVQNPSALGNAWFVNNINYVKDAPAEMIALNTLNTKTNAVAQESFKNIIGDFAAADSSESIKQIKFDNDAISYESNTKGKRLAVFSEIFYKDWHAYIDGNKIPIAKVNYVLRAINIPEGKHKIEFKFEPSLISKSKTLSVLTNFILIGLILFGIYAFYTKKLN